MVPFGSFDIEAVAAEEADKAEKIEVPLQWSGLCFKYEFWVVQVPVLRTTDKRRFVEN